MLRWAIGRSRGSGGSEIRFEVLCVTDSIMNKLEPAELEGVIAHELSHVLLRHELSEIREVSGVPFRTCRPDEEEQATSFGGTLLLPRPLLVSAARQGLGIQQIAEKYNVTLEMARFRYNSTGVKNQVPQTAAR